MQPIQLLLHRRVIHPGGPAARVPATLPAPVRLLGRAVQPVVQRLAARLVGPGLPPRAGPHGRVSCDRQLCGDGPHLRRLCRAWPSGSAPSAAAAVIVGGGRDYRGVTRTARLTRVIVTVVLAVARRRRRRGPGQQATPT